MDAERQDDKSEVHREQLLLAHLITGGNSVQLTNEGGC